MPNLIMVSVKNVQTVFIYHLKENANNLILSARDLTTETEIVLTVTLGILFKLVNALLAIAMQATVTLIVVELMLMEYALAVMMVTT